MQALRETTNTRAAASDAAPAHKVISVHDEPLAEYPGTLLAMRAGGPRFTVEDFDLAKKTLGQGQFGMVYKAKHRESKRWLVIKVLEKAAIVEHEVKRHLQHEVEVHARLVHPNILRLYAQFQDADRGALWLLGGAMALSCGAIRTPPRLLAPASPVRRAAHVQCSSCWSLPTGAHSTKSCRAPWTRRACSLADERAGALLACRGGVPHLSLDASPPLPRDACAESPRPKQPPTSSSCASAC